MSSWLTVDINIFAILTLMAVLVSVSFQSNRKHMGTRLFKAMAISNIMLLALEIATWLSDGIAGLHSLTYTSNFIFLALNPLPALCWVNYLDYRLHGSVPRLKRRWFYLQPVIGVLVLLLVSIPFEFVFSVDEAGFYHRHGGLYLIAATNYGLLAYAFVVYLRQRHSADPRLVGVLVAFAFVPAIAAVFQLLFFGVLVIWAAMSIAVLITYIFLEVHELSRDYLTGLLARRQMDDLIDARMRERKRRGIFGLIMIDLDNFKTINDTYGHDAGDSALIAFSSIVSQSVKRRDVVSRFAGDEFIILVETEDSDELEHIVDRLRNRLSEYNDKDIVPYTVDFSAGSVIYDPTKHTDYESLLREVDTVMYNEKRRRKASRPNTSQ